MSDIEYDRDSEREEPKPYYQFGNPNPNPSNHHGPADHQPPPERRPDIIGLDLPQPLSTKRHNKTNKNPNGNDDDGDQENEDMDKDQGKDDEEADVVYEVTEKPQFHTTRALFIGNLRRPINAGDFQRYLRGIAAEADITFKIDRAWLNRLRTHAVVLVSTEEGAEYLRREIMGKIYPGEAEDLRLKEEFENSEIARFENEKRHYEEAVDDEEREKLPAPVEPRDFVTERLPLYVEFIPVKAINQWTFEEDKGPKNGKWKLEFVKRDDDDVVVSHTLLNGDFIPRYHPRQSHRSGGGGGGTGYGYGSRRDYDRGYHRGGGHDRYYPGRNGHGHGYGHGHGHQAPYSRGPVSSTDSYIPGRPPRSTEPRTTDSYVPSRSRDRSRSRSRSRSPRRSDRY
ncbi:uncharacterized protein LODBEIA_P53740 [Lodderomyces beijingensis]|uniref:RRM domain-containing protein n=1 Tax=Lodderomyces beijingensis TaxID=1775926 RepID=A0ABP0ZV70_9ASCO